jgi:hypothetical protein
MEIEKDIEARVAVESGGVTPYHESTVYRLVRVLEQSGLKFDKTKKAKITLKKGAGPTMELLLMPGQASQVSRRKILKSAAANKLFMKLKFDAPPGVTFQLTGGSTFSVSRAIGKVVVNFEM